ncbi:MAG: hypothetical protein LBF91_04950, partial [Azoarcus sp.]|nr:hypothetical protein [Azoarcus sp.]
MTGCPLPRHQRGSTLIVAMVLLLVMSLLAMTSLRGTNMQERMSANAHDRDLAFQTAEAGLRMGEHQAEKWATGAITPPAETTGCPAANPGTGLYVMSAATHDACTPLWERQANYWHHANAEPDIAFDARGLSRAPYYIVELISANASCNPGASTSSARCKRFRITAASDDGGGRARVVLQSIYATE